MKALHTAFLDFLDLLGEASDLLWQEIYDLPFLMHVTLGFTVPFVMLIVVNNLSRSKAIEFITTACVGLCGSFLFFVAGLF